MPRASLGELEQQIYLLLQSKTKASVKEMCLLLNNTRKYTTVMTIMNRLVAKKELLREKQGACFVYWINQDQIKKQLPLLTKLKQSLFQGKTKTMVSYLLESDQKITKQELLEIEKIISKMKGQK